ncbi:PrsW family intramembrane metalloprotease [Cryptosporangium phraense]|uniref:PrsW family intramembrane metalloprotease n=1 Tax=Cryptosporangium phraense TaxID=2593070 RepID=A0A545AJA0_9ACTN|nr:PrsW family intramembrane metalloprotease [Cryptosporangium phraense]TQS41330.1 PrsW family intramembrane metalloprotease [Cryptosporangium phraense]
MSGAQLSAIEESGWGTPYRFVQLTNPAFWVYLIGVGAGAVGLFKFFAPAVGPYSAALTSGIVLFAIYLGPWLLLLRHHNRYTAQPGGLLATGFVWGGVAATFWIALPANDALLEVWSKVLGPATASDWGAGLTAPINEEWSKGLGLILLIGLAPRLVRSAYDGFIIGAYIGLGFQVFEDVLYVYNNATSTFGADQLSSTLSVFALRGVAGIVSHALFSAIFCAGVMWVLGRVPEDRKFGRGVLACLVAMFFHFSWDDAGALAGGVDWLAVVLPWLVLLPVELAVLFFVLRHAATTERGWTRALLEPEVAAGVVDADLLTAVSGLRRDRKRYRKHLGSRRRARHLIEAAGDLAHEIATARGEDTPRVQHARAELLRLREA